MQLHIFPNIDQLSISVADWMVDHINKILQKQGRFTLVLSGGGTPKKLNALLSSDAYKSKIDWTKIHIFFGDERFVPLNDERNNAKLAFDTLLNYVPVAADNIHIMQTEHITPAQSAEAYEKILKTYFDEAANNELQAASIAQQTKNDNDSLLTTHYSPFTTHHSQLTTFDLVILGMGDDGHTLSLFPGKKEVIHETRKWCTSLWLEEQNMFRVTLTHGIVNKSAAVAFLVNGSNKAKALHKVLKGNYDPDLFPSQIIKPSNGELHWFLDDAAAAEL